MRSKCNAQHMFCVAQCLVVPYALWLTASTSTVHDWNCFSLVASPRRLSGLLRVIVHASQQHFGDLLGQDKACFSLL